MAKKKKNSMAGYKLIKTSLEHQGKIFFEESTLHGVRYIAESGRPLVEKLMWFVCVLIGAIATMVIIVSLWEKFQTNPTITGLDTDFHTWDVPFPAVTICQSTPSNESIIDDYIDTNMPGTENKEAVKSFLMKLAKLSYYNLKDFKGEAEEGFLASDVDIKTFVFQLMNPCEYILTTCLWKSEAYNCCDSFFPIFTEIGFCYTFNSRHYERKIPWADELLPEFKLRYIKETDTKWSLGLSVEQASEDYNISIYIHNSDDVPGVDTKPQHVWDFRVDRILFSVKQTYTTEDAKQLSIKQRHCIFEHEKNLKVDNIYTYTACTKQCRMDTSIRLCGCVPHFYPENLEHNYRHCRLKELSCVAENLMKIEDSEKCRCYLGCSNTVYEVEKLSEIGKELLTTTLETEFVSWPMVRYKREVLFGWVDLLVSFGGIAGLFLGFSLLSGVEVIYYFTIRACCMAYREKDELIRLEEDGKNKKRPEYDLSLKPYFVEKPTPGQAKKEIAKRYRGDINFNKKLLPIKVKPINPNSKLILPPFGIEFMN